MKGIKVKIIIEVLKGRVFVPVVEEEVTDKIAAQKLNDLYAIRSLLIEDENKSSYEYINGKNFQNDTLIWIASHTIHIKTYTVYKHTVLVDEILLAPFYEKAAQKAKKELEEEEIENFQNELTF